MYNGSFEDRNDARLGVKEWLRTHSPAEYTPGNLQRLARKMMLMDREPVDDVRVAWRERGYGIVQGLAEFAAEELKHSQEESSSAACRAGDEIGLAVSMIPSRSSRAARHLRAALEMLRSNNSDSVVMDGSRPYERASIAVTLAISLLGSASGSGTHVKAAA